MTLKERFNVYDQDNPHIYALFKEKAELIRAAGKHKYSGWAIANAIRWEFDTQVTTDEPFKLSNDFIACYVRKLIDDDSSFEGFFTLRPAPRLTEQDA